MLALWLRDEVHLEKTIKFVIVAKLNPFLRVAFIMVIEVIRSVSFA